MQKTAVYLSIRESNGFPFFQLKKKNCFKGENLEDRSPFSSKSSCLECMNPSAKDLLNFHSARNPEEPYRNEGEDAKRNARKNTAFKESHQILFALFCYQINI